MIHLDLKPGNILLTSDGLPKVSDFGLAKRIEGEAALAETYTVRGTPSYMAPEQTREGAKAMGPRTDVYGLGAVLYACLTGRPPFQGASVPETMRLVQQQEPIRFATCGPMSPWTCKRSASIASPRTRPDVTPPPRPWPRTWTGSWPASR